MRNRFAHAPLAFGLAVLGLAACGNAAGVRIDNIDISQNYDQRELGIIAGGDRALRVEVINNPFPEISQEAFAVLVVGSMRGRALGFPVNFSLEPQVEYRPERRRRALVVFDPPRSLRSVGLCRRDDIKTAAVPDVGVDSANVRALGAYCQGGATLTRVIGRVPRGIDATSTNLDGLIAQITATLFPIRNRNQEDDEGCSPFVLVC